MKRKKIHAVCAQLGCDESDVVEAAGRLATEAREARVLITAAEAALTRTEDERVRLEAELAAAGQLLEARDGEALLRNASITRISEELAASQHSSTKLASALEAAEAEAARAMHETHRLREERSQQAAELTALRVELEARQAQIDAADGHAVALVAARAKLEAELEAQRLHVETLEATIASVHAEITAQHQQSARAVAEAIGDAVGLVAVLTDAVVCFRQMLALAPAERARVHAAAGDVAVIARGWLADVGVELGEPGAHLLQITESSTQSPAGLDAAVSDKTVSDEPEPRGLGLEAPAAASPVGVPAESSTLEA
jgi:hypothetical protein